jgi:hypothetical protein
MKDKHEINIATPRKPRIKKQEEIQQEEIQQEE